MRKDNADYLRNADNADNLDHPFPFPDCINNQIIWQHFNNQQFTLMYIHCAVYFFANSNSQILYIKLHFFP